MGYYELHNREHVKPASMLYILNPQTLQHPSILVHPAETLRPTELAHPFISRPCNRLRFLSRVVRPLTHYRATLHCTRTMNMVGNYRQNCTQRRGRNCSRLQLAGTVCIAWGEVTHGYLQGQWLAFFAQLYRHSATGVDRLCVRVPTHTNATAGRAGNAGALAGNQCTRKLRLRGHLARAAAGRGGGEADWQAALHVGLRVAHFGEYCLRMGDVCIHRGI
jgi:hypothetical protein